MKKRKTRINLPETPSEAFFDQAIAYAKQKGWEGDEQLLKDKILAAYHVKRSELLDHENKANR